MDALKNVVEVDESGRGLGHQQALNQSTDRSRAQPRVSAARSSCGTRGPPHWHHSRSPGKTRRPRCRADPDPAGGRGSAVR